MFFGLDISKHPYGRIWFLTLDFGVANRQINLIIINPTVVVFECLQPFKPHCAPAASKNRLLLKLMKGTSFGVVLCLSEGA
jgi:hypothetical protein